ncbi:hypothetical protein HWV62_8777 [Athelia sp. TMB]|nr:hypothetical protein HWV62_8777 [Athelia sp. TMB]
MAQIEKWRENANPFAELHAKLVAATTLIINDLPYADGAAFDPSKACIPGTREFVLDELHRWINERDGDDIPRLLVLTGAPGFGKSAIANTLAQHYDKVRRLGSFVSFSRADQARRHPANLLSTISRDIADLDPHWRVALCEVMEKNHSLGKSPPPIRQMENLVLGPAKSLSIAGPVVIIIDALDECGNPAARETLLQVLSQSASALPRNFRVLVTARPEKDIIRAFSDQHPNVQQRRLDTMDPATIDLDIAVFIERQLAPVIQAFDKEWLFREQWLGMLVTGSNHVFQWAATTCRAILEAEEHGVEYVTGLIAEILGAGVNLDDLYRLILCRKFPERDVSAIHRFKRVMGCILAAKEPLPKSIFVELCRQGDDEDFESVLPPLDSLLSGISDDTPIKARHTSFYDFLMDEGRSRAYFIDSTHYDRHFTKPCLRILKSGLKFNICELPSSYTKNTALADLPDCVAKAISPLLSYASRFLGRHLKHTPFDQDILDGLRALLKEQLLYWLEVLSLLKQMSAATRLFASIQAWAHDISCAAFVKDAIRFVETFAPPISQSAPHIYLSAVPFAPKQSLVSQTYRSQYPFTARLKVGEIDWWPAMLKTFEGHSDSVFAVAYSPNGKRIASVSGDGTIRLWDAETGEAAWGSLKGPRAAIWSIAYSPSGHRIISGSRDATIQMWDTETGELVRSPFKHSGQLRCIAHSPDGTYIVTGSEDGTTCIWDAETGEATQEPIQWNNGGIFWVAYSPDGLHIASGQGMTVNIWNSAAGEAVGSLLRGHSGAVNCVVYSPDGAHIASCSEDKTIRLWNTQTRQAVWVLEGHTGTIWSLAYSPDGRRLASGSDDKTIRLWDVEKGEQAGAPLEGHTNRVFSVAYSPDGTHIVSGSGDCTVRVWDAEVGERTAAEEIVQSPSTAFQYIAYSPDGASIVSGSQEGAVQIWDADTGQPMLTQISEHHDDPSTVPYSPDGKLVVSGSEDHTIQAWDALAGKAVHESLKGHGDVVMSIAYSPDGSQIASGSNDGTIRIWVAKSGEPLGEPFKGHDGAVWSVAYSPDGMQIASGAADKTLRIWNVETGEQLSVIDGHENVVSCVAYSPDGTRIVSGSVDTILRQWDVERGEAIGSPLHGHSDLIRTIAHSPDGKTVVSGSDDQTLRLWDAESGRSVGAPIKVHSGFVMSVAYSPDGTRIASASLDSTIRTWDVAKMQDSADIDASVEFRHDSRVDNGWITTASSQLLVWLPSWYRQGLVWPSNVAIMGSSLTELDLTDFVHGSDWHSCKADVKIEEVKS